jgi:hypothetical protein
MWRRLAGLALLAATPLTPAFAYRSADQISIFLDSDENHTINMSMGGATNSCSDHYWAGGQSRFDSLRLTKKPRFGRVEPQNAYSQVSFQYTRKANWKGADSFAIRLCGQ